jgi:hypothetical protein
MDLSNYQPNIVDRWLHVAQSGYAAVERRYIGRMGFNPKIIVLHIQEGSNWGSWQHFHVVKASSTVLIGKTGEIWRLVPESDGPWTNGDVMNPSALGWEVINKWGADPNPYSLTIETEGFTGNPIPEAQLKAVVWQIHDWMTKYGIPLRYVLRHADINSVSRPNCPGNAYYNQVIDALKSLQEPTPPAPVYAPAKKVIVDGVAWDGTKDVMVGTSIFHGQVGVVVLNKDDVKFRQVATFESDSTRSDLDKDVKVSVLGWVNGSARDGEGRWWITKYFSRLWVGDTVEKPTVVTPVEDGPEELPEGAKYVQGRVYYRTFEGEQNYRTVTTKSKANLRAEPHTDSKVVGSPMGSGND